MPYALEFQTHKVQQYKVKHDNKEELCNKCLDQGHTIRNCLLNTCFHCKEKGHNAIDCKEIYEPDTDEEYDIIRPRTNTIERQKAVKKKISNGECKIEFRKN